MESIQVHREPPRLHSVQVPTSHLHHREDVQKYTVMPQASEIYIQNTIPTIKSTTTTTTTDIENLCISLSFSIFCSFFLFFYSAFISFACYFYVLLLHCNAIISWSTIKLDGRTFKQKRLVEAITTKRKKKNQKIVFAIRRNLLKCRHRCCYYNCCCVSSLWLRHNLRFFEYA